jgi:hypothetical protein
VLPEPVVPVPVVPVPVVLLPLPPCCALPLPDVLPPDEDCAWLSPRASKLAVAMAATAAAGLICFFMISISFPRWYAVVLSVCRTANASAH